MKLSDADLSLVDIPVHVVSMVGRRVRPPFFRERFPTIIVGESMTHQSHAASVDINAIVARFQRTGQLPPGNGPGVYADVTALQGDLVERAIASQEVIERARSFGKEWDKEQAAKAAARAVPAPPTPPPAGTPPTG